MSGAVRTRRALTPSSPTIAALWAIFVAGDGLGRQSSVFQMVRRRSACLLLSITTAVRRDRPTGDRATERHKVFAADRRGSEARNLRLLKFASGLDPDEKLEAIEDAGPAALRQRPFDLPTADCRPKGLSVMESQISKVYAPSNATGRQLTITKIAHKTGVVRDLGIAASRVLAACDMPAERRRATALDRTHHLQLLEAHMPAVGLAPGRTVIAENVRDFQSWSIGIGGSLTTPPLPHHRTYGSVYGGSID